LPAIILARIDESNHRGKDPVRGRSGEFGCRMAVARRIKAGLGGDQKGSIVYHSTQQAAMTILGRARIRRIGSSTAAPRSFGSFSRGTRLADHRLTQGPVACDSPGPQAASQGDGTFPPPSRRQTRAAMSTTI
jgi:hypothetical protein